MAGDAVVIYSNVTAVTCAVRCSTKYPCGGYSYSRRDRVCMFCALCSNFSLLDAPGYRFYVIAKEPSGSSSDDGTICSSGSGAAADCWKACPRAMDHVSVGPAGVWAVDSADRIYYRAGTYQDPHSSGTTWTLVYGALAQLDVGTDIIWGVNSVNIPWYRDGISTSDPDGSRWKRQSPDMKWVSISPGESVWARKTTDRVIHYDASAWQDMGMDIQQVDVGLAGVWVLNTTGHLFHRLGTHGDSGSAGTEWRALEGTFQSVASGRDVVVVVDMEGRVWLRSGVGSDTPTGLAWLLYPGSMKQVDVYQAQEGFALWGVDDAGQVFHSVFED